MRELVRANDPVLISFVRALLTDAGIAHAVVDQYTSVVEGSVGILACRVLVAEDDLDGARKVLTEADLAHEISRRAREREDGEA